MVSSYGDLLANFEIDPNNVNASVPPANLRDFIAAAGSQIIPFTLGLFVNDLSRVYICPSRFDRAIGVPPSSLDTHTFVFDGELHHNQGLSVEIDNSCYNLIPNATNVPATIGGCVITVSLVSMPKHFPLPPWSPCNLVMPWIASYARSQWQIQLSGLSTS